MKRLRCLISRSILTIVVVGVACVLNPRVALAGPISFTVDESAVPGATPGTVSPDPNDITGKYEEIVTFGAGTFSSNLVVVFTGYVLNGTPVPSQIGAPAPGGEGTDTNLYTLYALVTVSGTFSVIPGVITQFNFEPTTSQADIYIDPNRDTVTNYLTASVTSGGGEDLHIMSANTLDQSQSLGVTLVCSVPLLCGGPVLGGFYALIYENVSVIAPDGTAYWPSLASLTLEATASGDVDTSGQGSIFPTDVRGDTDITFNQVGQVPEPASLVLLGTGLLAARFGARRRRATK